MFSQEIKLVIRVMVEVGTMENQANQGSSHHLILRTVPPLFDMWTLVYAALWK